jgi:hypothetical protein
MSSNSKVLINVTKDRMAFIRQQAEIRGIDIKGVNGDFKYDHVNVHYEYDQDKKTVLITPTLPLYITENEFWGHVLSALGTGQIAQSNHLGKPVASADAPVQLVDPSSILIPGNVIQPAAVAEPATTTVLTDKDAPAKTAVENKPAAPAPAAGTTLQK